MEKTKDDGGSAFPMPPHMGILGTWMSGAGGMSLRDWFAGQALFQSEGFYPSPSPERLAEIAYKIADAMLRERAKE